jgi:hypothetical protein
MAKPKARRGQAPAAPPGTCPWCSAEVPSGADRCPSCGAALAGAPEGDIPGVTRVDPAPPLGVPQNRTRRLVAWLSGDRSGDTEVEQARVEPPSEAVRREMLRLELAAIDAEIEAKANQVAAERAELEEGGNAPA